MDIPDIIKGRIVPSTVQLHGEIFHREKNLDEYFDLLCAVVEAAKNCGIKSESLVAALDALEQES